VFNTADVFGNYARGMSLKLYSWALTIVYSRAIGLWNQNKYVRVLAPILDMANHKEMGEISIVKVGCLFLHDNNCGGSTKSLLKIAFVVNKFAFCLCSVRLLLTSYSRNSFLHPLST
jgi:hypothetical protein